MANLLYRQSTTPTTPGSTSSKNAPLSNLEVDGNFKSIDNDLASKAPLTGTGASGTWSISVSGNSGTVTDGLYSTGSYANPAWITSLAETKVLPSQTTFAGKYLTTNGTTTSWATVDAGAKGGEGNAVFWENDQTISLNYSITVGKNAGTFGPIAVADGVIVTVPDGAAWTIV